MHEESEPEDTSQASDDEVIRHSAEWHAIKQAKPFLPDHEITELARTERDRKG